MHRFGVALANDSVPETLPEVDQPETGEVIALRELGALLESDERFAALHDTMAVHTATTEEGFDLRVIELWSPQPDDEMAMGLIVSLSLGRQVLGVWDLGYTVESVEAIECESRGRFEIVVVPRSGDDDDEPAANRVSVSYSVRGDDGGSLRVRFGKASQIVARSAQRRDLFLQRILRVHDVEVEREDLIHARIFECDAREGVPGIDVILQLSDSCGKTRTFDLGMDVMSLALVTQRDDRDLVLAGRALTPKGSGPVTAVVRALGTKALPDRIAVARSR